MDFKNENNNSSNNNIKQTEEELGSQIIKLYIFKKNNQEHPTKRDSMMGITHKLTGQSFSALVKMQTKGGILEAGYEEAKNSSLPSFENSEKYRGLIYFANFNEDCTKFTIINVNKDNLTPLQLEQYNEAVKMEKELNTHSDLAIYMQKNGFTYPEITKYTVEIVGKPLDDLSNRLINYGNINDKLPEDAYFINYRGTPYIYVTTQKAYRIVVHYLKYISDEIIPIFYKTFNDGIGMPEETVLEFPPAVLFPNGSDFWSNDETYVLEISSITAYYILVQRKIYQKYVDIDTWANGKDFTISINFDTDNFEKIIPLIDEENDLEVLNYLKENSIPYITDTAKNNLLSIIEDRISIIS